MNNADEVVVLSLLTFYFQQKLPETARYTALVANNAEKARKDMEKVMQVKITIQETKTNKTKFGLFSKEFLRRHGLHLIGTASTWFFVDVAYYSQNLFQKEIFSAVGRLPPAKTMSALDKLFKVSFAQFLIAFCGTVPGYWVTVLLIDRIGRFVIQIMSFFFMTVFMLALAIPYHHWTLNKAGFLIMYGLTFFFANFGPNSTTFIVPAEIFPARLRSTCHGISAAAGKAGAIVGAFGFLYASQNQDKCKTDAGYPAGIGIRNSLFILSGINVLRLLCTFLVPEAKGRSLEEMSRDDEEEEQEQQQDPQSGVSDVGRMTRWGYLGNYAIVIGGGIVYTAAPHSRRRRTTTAEMRKRMTVVVVGPLFVYSNEAAESGGAADGGGENLSKWGGDGVIRPGVEIGRIGSETGV
ncbi:PREDICTED: probable inorganic phosphate transporter 1-8 [Erythranthe guttata]|uniref:probable inorganic phosphate transporter 1-8 n=1 Tax=Erythranthe guttata TaxID=4155 RepID=UPI00064E0FF1|nr:PREDICTED: probable inorganic phosphate transporter 1-8 [Erythranthe guttata]|eukprot:XP_012837622.1 PREDICTED: probable inorganic phosphate transporter 1-8 [Erythranthe guttata]